MSMYKIISVQSKGAIYKILVDEIDFNRVKNFTWGITHSGNNVYAKFTMHLPNNKKTSIAMHRLIMSFPNGFLIDHINGNGLDNRRENLRLCNSQQNSFNRKPYRWKTLPKGVSKKLNRFISRITINKTTINIGSYKTIEEAKDAYNLKANDIFKEYRG